MMQEINNITNMTAVGDSSDSTAANVVLCLVFTLLITWIIVGNATVILSVKKTPALRASLSNILVANLAFSDLLLGVLVLPLSAMVEVFGWWPPPKELCFFWLVIGR